MPESSSDSRRLTRFIARQAIFDTKEHVYGYELLFRSGEENRCIANDLDDANRDVVDNLLNADAKTLTVGRRAFINCTRDFLVGEYAVLLPKEDVVLEILETVEPEAEVLAACRKLKDLGYVIALDDFVYAEKFRPFVELADIIKIDFRLSPPDERRQAVGRFAPFGIRMLAEKVETRTELAEAHESGYVYFQGYFFCQPQIVPSRYIPAFKLHYLQILQAISKPELDRSEIESLIEREVSLCYKLLRFVNSALFGFTREVKSIGHALNLLGDRAVKKWAMVAAVLGMADNQPNELVLTALTRGRCCELLTGRPGARCDQHNMFLLGALSLMEPMLGRPLPEIVAEIALPELVRAALLGKLNPYRETLDLIKAYEAGQWSEVSRLALSLSYREDDLSATYVAAVDWAHKLFQV